MTASIKLKRSAVSGKAPQLSDLQLGEIAINTFDGKIYIKKDNGTQSIIAIGNGTGGSDQYIVTGDVTGTLDNIGANALTLPDVNANVGTFGTTDSSVTLTLNAKGQVTAASANAIAIAASQVTTGQFADARISSSSVTQHAADLAIDENQITPGTLLARLTIIDPAVQVFTGDNEFTSPITSVAPTNPFHLATKQYVDSVSAGLDPKESVLAATTANITLAGLQTIDGFSVPQGGRVLVKDQTDGTENGIYLADASNWNRSADFDGSPSAEVTTGAFCLVVKGTANGATGWVLLTPDPISIGSTVLDFTQFSAATAGGTVSSVDASGGSTGLTFTGGPVTSAGTLILGGTLAIGNGGTGASTQSGAANAVLPLQSLQAGKFLATNGATVSWQSVNTVAGNNGQMLYNNNGLIDAATSIYTDGTNTFTGEQSNVGVIGANPPTGGDLTFQGGNAQPGGGAVGTAGSVFITAGKLVTGGFTGSTSGSVVVSAPAGGTTNTGNVRFLTDDTERFRILTDGSWSIGSTGADFGAAGDLLVSQGVGLPPVWQATTGAGTVTSVDADGGTTGLTFTGGPITAAGTLTLSGTVSAAHGGTGLVTPTGYLHGDGTVIAAVTTIPTSVLTGNLPVARFDSATGATGTTFWRGDGTWATPVASSGTVSSVDIAGATNLGLTFSGGPITSSGTITIDGTLGFQHGGTGVSQTSRGEAFTEFSPIRNPGDLIIGTGGSQAGRLAVGAAGQLLTSSGTGVSWEDPATSGGTVTAVTVTTANGVSAAVANQGTTPALTFSLGAITPSSVTMASSNQFLSNLAGATTTSFIGIGQSTINMRLGVSGATDALSIGTAPGDVVLNYTNSLFMGNAGAAPKFLIDSDDNVVLNSGAVSTAATDGFLYITTSAGQPLGTPTTYSGRQPMIIDTTNGVMYFYTGTNWKATNTGGNPTAAGLQGYVQFNNAGGLGADAGLLFTPASQTLTLGSGAITSALVTAAGTDSSFSIDTGAGSAASGINLLAGTTGTARGADITLTSGSTTGSATGVSNIVLNAGGGVGTYDSTHGVITLRTGAIGIISSSNTLVDRLSILPGGAWSVGTGGTATGTSGQILKSTGALTPPVWDLVDLASSVTGNLAMSHLDSGTNADATTFLRGDGVWITPPGSGGTVTSVSIVPANGVSGTVATQTTTPAITLVLGAITPSSVVSSGDVTGLTLTGPLTTAAQPVITSVGTLTSLDVTGNITAADPTTASQVATKQYVDNLATGLSPKNSARATTTTNIINLATVNGAIGTTLDGVTLTAGDRILVRNQTAPAQNGIWIYNGPSALATRASDFDGTPTTEVEPGTYVLVISGTLFATSGWIVSNTGTGTGGSIIVGTDPINFVQFSSGGGAAAFNVKDEGVSLTTTVTGMDFVGGGITATNAGGNVTVTVNGTVSNVSVVTANGVSAAVANATSTPALTFTLGDITPNSVAATADVSGATGTFTTTISPTVRGIDTATNGVAGGAITLRGGNSGNPSSAGTGGAVTIAGGSINGGDTTSGASGGAVSIVGGNTSSASGAGGSVTIAGGNITAFQNTNAGNVNINGGIHTTGTSSGLGGSIVFSTATTGTLTERMRITNTGALTFAGTAGTLNQILTSDTNGIPSWQDPVPAGISSFAFTSANGITGTVTNPTTTPALSLSLGAITPSSISVSGAAAFVQSAGTLTLGSAGGATSTYTIAGAIAATGSAWPSSVLIKGGDQPLAASPVAGSLTLAGGNNTSTSTFGGNVNSGGSVFINGGLTPTAVSGQTTIGGDIVLSTAAGGLSTAAGTLVERLRVKNTGEWTLAGASATAGQVLTVVSAGAAPTWQTSTATFAGGTVAGATTFSAVATATTPTLQLSSASSAMIAFATGTVAAPIATGRSLGSKLVLFPETGTMEYAIGMETATMWFSTPTASNFRWYGGTTTNIMQLSSTGILSLSSTGTPTGNVPSITGTAINFGATGVAPPNITGTHSAGAKLIMYSEAATGVADFAIGIDSATMWFSTGGGTDGYAWYTGATSTMTLNVANGLTIAKIQGLLPPLSPPVTGVPTGAGTALTLSGSNAAVTAATAGGAINISGGNGLTTGVGGAVNISGGTSPTGTGGAIVLTTTATERLRILANGAWSVGTGGAATGTSGQVLTSTGTTTAPSWQTITAALPAQASGNAGQFLVTDGTNAAWTNQVGPVASAAASVTTIPATSMLLLDGTFATDASLFSNTKLRLVQGTGIANATAAYGFAIGSVGDIWAHAGDITATGFTSGQHVTAIGGKVRTRVSGSIVSGTGANIVIGTQYDIYNTAGVSCMNLTAQANAGTATGALTQLSLVGPAANTVTATTGAGLYISGRQGGNAQYIGFNNGFGTLGVVNAIQSLATGTGTPVPIQFQLRDGFTLALQNNGDMVMGLNANAVTYAAFATTAAAGFPFIPSMAGTPTGTPAVYTGRQPLVIDSTNSLLYMNTAGTWKAVGSAIPTLTLTSATPTITGNFSGLGAASTTNRLSIISNTGAGTIVEVLSPATTAGTSIVAAFSRSTPANSSYAALASDEAGGTSYIDAGSVVGGTAAALPFVVKSAAAAGGVSVERIRFLINGSISFGSAGTNVGTAGQVLTSQGAAAPTWTTPDQANVLQTTAAVNGTSGGGAITLTLAAATTAITFTGTVPTTKQSVFTFYLTQDATGGRAVTWPVGTKFPGGGSPTLTVTAGATDIIVLRTPDGVNFYGEVIGMNY